MLTLEGEIHRYGNTVGDALMQEMYFIYSLMHNAQFILSTTFPIHYSLIPHLKNAVYTVSKKSNIQLIVITWQDLLGEETLYQFCH